MVAVNNTNLTIGENMYILTFCVNENLSGKRYTVLTYNLKETLKKYKKAGFYIFGSGMKYENNMFLALNKAFKPKTINKQKIYVSNAMYFINKALSENTLKLEL
jgi:hypothetical protein